MKKKYLPVRHIERRIRLRYTLSHTIAGILADTEEIKEELERICHRLRYLYRESKSR